MERRLFLGARAATLVQPLRASGSSLSAAELVKPAALNSADGLKITNETGEVVTISSWRGRWVLLALWSPWCLPCREEMPALAQLSDRLDPEIAAVLPLAFDGRGPRWVRKFYREIGVTNLPVYLGNGQNLDTVLGLSALPSAALIDPDGRHVSTVLGPATWDDPATLQWMQGLNS